MQRNRKVWPMYMRKEQATEAAYERDQRLDFAKQINDYKYSQRTENKKYLKN